MPDVSDDVKQQVKEEKIQQTARENLERRKMKESRDGIQEVRKKYDGTNIESIMKVSWKGMVEDSVSIDRNKEATATYNGVRYNKKGVERISRFPKNICQSLVKFFTEPGDTVFDPFAGHNSRMEAVFELGRNYVGYDISEEYMAFNETVKDRLIGNIPVEDRSKRFIRLTCRNSMEIDDKEVGDFCITSPPYWQQEKYTDEPGQLYFCRSYQDFMGNLKEIMDNVFNALKPGAYLCWNVNDFQKDGKFYNYHGDCINLLKDLGFNQKGIIIMDFGSSIRAIFVNQVEEKKIIPKRHEYIIVCQKP
jgi:DNA modification methylase